MNVLVTGPSCSGKTTVGRSLQGCCQIVQLDRVAGCCEVEEPGHRHEPVFYEGLPSGSQGEIERFFRRMDVVILLQVPFARRLRRMIDRDGPAAMGRFVYNEFAWHRYLAATLARVERIEVIEAASTEEAIEAARYFLMSR